MGIFKIHFESGFHKDEDRLIVLDEEDFRDDFQNFCTSVGCMDGPHFDEKIIHSLACHD